MHVNDVERSLKEIVKNSGKVVQEKTQVQGEMYTAYCADREGNVMSLARHGSSWCQIKDGPGGI